MRAGAQFEHSPILNKFLVAASFIFIVFLIIEVYKKRSLQHLERWWLFCGVLLIACWIAYNQQILTGMTVWPYHFVQFTIPLSLIALFVLGINYGSHISTRLWGVVISLALLASLAVGVSSALSYHQLLNNFSEKQSHMPIFSWLNTHAAKDCVVLVNEVQESFAMQIPAFTHCNTYVTTGTFYGVPEDRIMHNFLTLLRLWRVTPAEAQSYLESHPSEVNTYFFNSIAQSLTSIANAETKQHVADIVKKYPEFYRHDFATELRKYRIDYFLSTDKSQLPSNLTLRKEMQSGVFTLYRVE
jgi:hypothetical protein